MSKEHHYNLNIRWTGNRGTGTSGYTAYDRSHDLEINGKEILSCSSDPAFRGDKSKYNPEDFLLASLASCHMLWYLHLCADAGIIVMEYVDSPTAIMTEGGSEGGHFISATLNPVVTVKEESMKAKADSLHDEANKKCFIANSVNFPVKHNPKSIIP
jgi:organic hydroperoxide reductase OsmC/OhrA